MSIDHEPSHSPVAHSCRARTRTDEQARGYANKYRTIRMERRNGILQMTLHTDGGSLRWGFLPHGELPDTFYDVGADRESRMVIITGTGAEFSGPRANPGTSSFPTRPSIERIDRIDWEGRNDARPAR